MIQILMQEEKAKVCTSAKFVYAARHSTNCFLVLRPLESSLVLLPFGFRLSLIQL